MSMDARSATPSLLRKASMNSLHGVGGVTPPRSSPSRASLSGRSSSAQYRTGRSPLAEKEQEADRAPRHTAVSIARIHFEKELELHRRVDDTRHADTIAILHDSCYGHRYSRPRTSKANLMTIVERPERIQASILGLSVAYVRLGERHSEGNYPLHPSQDPASIPSSPFRIRKTSRKLPLASQAVTNVHGAKWMEELKIMCDSAEGKLALNGKELIRPEMTRTAGEKTPSKFHEGDLYLCAESLDAMEGALGAVCEGVDAIFEGSASGKGPHRAFVTIRPPGHHCSASYPSGFCWLNNIHVGISHAALTHGLTHAAILDFDLHHGDGSQAITWAHNSRANSLGKNALPWKKSSIGYFSLHDINSYPCEMGDEEKVKNASLCIENAHGQSIWNVHLQPWKSETEFWELYETKYSVILEKTRNYLRAQTERFRANPNGLKPKGAIFLSAGFDASEWESSGMQRHKVNVPTEFYARITRDVVRIAAEEGTSVDGRVISVLEGGYSDRALYSGVLSHMSGLAGGAPLIIKQEPNHGGLGYEMGQKISAYNGIDPFQNSPTVSEVQEYDPLWWSLPRLEQLDLTVNPNTPPADPRKPREGPAPTYSSPTQSFIAKVISPSARRSVSSMSMSGSPRAYSRPPTPPPPEVHWTVAAHELSKLLIPSDRQISSCSPGDLAAEATRVRRDRQSILTPPMSGSDQLEPVNGRMALRTRKPAKPIIESPDEDEVKKPRANRRKTVTGSMNLGADMVTYVKPSPPEIGDAVVASTKNPNPSSIENITSSMQKVKISLMTKAQREAKEREGREPTKRAPKAPAKRAPTKNTISKSIEQPTKQTVQPMATTAGPVSSLETVNTSAPIPNDVPLPPSSPSGPLDSFSPPVSPPNQPPFPSTSTPKQDVFIQYEPEGPPPNAMTPVHALHFLPPNVTSTPTRMKRNQLPVFTSSSVIPFASKIVEAPVQAVPGQDTGLEQRRQEPTSPRDIWGVPDTPDR
ncbi:putative histone deacetylase HOS3 [Amylocarpus encephaloides]|uniref:Histone deacetylase HOS3 n=1 Tax=Amylocarpus encephaloides TaxID=45428 RepID=A0A9P7YSB7_9HELO|nr:putative histone deacetylase HOS3 [Amylocarpus encephaloides]